MENEITEVEKMYARAMIKPLSITVCGVGEQIINYPPFTAEKQLELIKVIANRECFVANYVPKRNIFILSSEDYSGTQIKFSDALAELINSLWQDLTEQERTEIAEILRG